MTENTLLKGVVGLALVLSITCSAVVVILWSRGTATTHQLQKQVGQVNRALCLAKADDARAVHVGNEFLKAHPDGTPDFSRKFILMSIHQAQIHLANLADVQCTKEELQH